MPTSPALATDYADAVAVGEAIRAATRPVSGPAEQARPAQEATPYPIRGAAVPETVGALLARHRTLAGPAEGRAIPALMFTVTRDKMALFLSRLLACTGSVEAVQQDDEGGALDISVRAASPSPRMARQVQHLLLRFGGGSAVGGKVLTLPGGQAPPLFPGVGLVCWGGLRGWGRFCPGRLVHPPGHPLGPLTGNDHAR